MPNSNSRFKRITRLVVLPDYQGVGIGTALLNYVANYYSARGFIVTIVSSQINVIKNLHKKGWIMKFYGHHAAQNNVSSMRSTQSRARITATFRYRSSNTNKKG